MAAARFQFANPVRPSGGAIPIRSAAWRLIGGNNRDLGCSPAEFESLEVSRQAVLRLRSRITEAVPLVTIDPQSSEWTWRLEIDGVVVARSARGYLRHRECLYNVSHFLGSVPVAALPGEPAAQAALLAAKTPAALAWVAAVLAIEAARAETDPAGAQAAGEGEGEQASAGSQASASASASPSPQEHKQVSCDLSGGAA